ncbi:hypothetical protein B9Z55_026522 [Caenorhabditis nigoni]|uniref:Uncharacterized protein n=1 Tax=Caenorhabditis nigoni TaxID=1611254 RepID=A0A2G5T352_9PELO|nr:hypothetical protein B9Z55_026522 [Caenorhabditis nigoni]
MKECIQFYSKQRKLTYSTGPIECLLWNKPRKKTFSMVPISLLRTALWFPFYEYRQKSTKRPQCIFPSLHVMSRPA